MREEQMLPHRAVQSIVANMKQLFEIHSNIIFDITDASCDGMAAFSGKSTVEEQFLHSVFDLVKSEKSLADAVRRHLLYVAPVQLDMDDNQRDVLHYVPLRPVLSKLFMNDCVFDEAYWYMLAQRNSSASTKLSDVPYDEIISKDCREVNTLLVPILLFIDDFEPCNPIGSRRKIHKLSGVYYSLACFPPKYRSQLKYMFLCMLFKTKMVSKHGYLKLMNRLVTDLKELWDSPIVLVTKGGRKVKLICYLKFILADNLGANDLGGFQRHFHHGYVSRFCKVTYSKLGIISDCNECPLRTDEGYQECITNLQNGKPGGNAGIVSECTFSTLPYLSVLTLFPADVFHDFSEGIAPVVMSVCIISLIEKKFISLDQLNKAVEKFPYKCNDARNKYRIPLTLAQLKKHAVPGTGAERLCLLKILTMIIYPMIKDQQENNPPAFELLKLCLEIKDIIMAPVIRKEWLSLLHRLIMDHHKLIYTLDSSAISPKFHYLVHYPELCLRQGPFRHTFTMRFEAMHQWFKRMTGRCRNFINLTHTLSSRFQNLQALHISDPKFMSKDMECGDERSIRLSDVHPQFCSLVSGKVGHKVEASEYGFTCWWLVKAGVRYQRSTIAYDFEHDDFDIPLFMTITHIIKLREYWFLFGTELRTKGFDENFHAWRVEESGRQVILKPGEEVDNTSLPVYTHCADRPLVVLNYRLTRR